MIDEKANSKAKVQYLIKTPKKSVIPRSEKQKAMLEPYMKKT